MNHFNQDAVQLFVSRTRKHMKLVPRLEIALKNESFQSRHCVTVCLSQKRTFGVSHTIKDHNENEQSSLKFYSTSHVSHNETYTAVHMNKDNIRNE